MALGLLLFASCAQSAETASVLTTYADGCDSVEASPITKANNIILSVALGETYPRDAGVVRYVLSAIRNVPTAEIHMIISNNYTGTGHVVHPRVVYHRLQPRKNFPFELTPLKVRVYAVACLLRRLPPQATVFVTDCRDAVFQDDISMRLNATGMVHLFQEHSQQRIKDGINAEWIRICAGLGVANAIDGFFVLNSGVIFGQVDLTRRLIRLIIDMLNTVNCDIDQAFLNVVVYTGRAAQAGVRFEVHAHEFGYVFNGFDAGKTGFRTVGCKVCNLKKKPYALVHQYDRLPKLVELVSACHDRHVNASTVPNVLA